MAGEYPINRFRILAIVLSIVLFSAGIAVTLGIFLPITGLVPAEHGLFRLGQRMFSVYGFSAFLIPILFLYGAVLLFIPGWSRESKAVFLGVPLYFITAIIGERLIALFSPSISIPLVRHFIIVSILICTVLLVSFEIFLMLMLSEKLIDFRFLSRGSAEDVLFESDEQESDEQIESAEMNVSEKPEASGKKDDTADSAPAESSGAASVPDAEVSSTVFAGPSPGVQQTNSPKTAAEVSADAPDAVPKTSVSESSSDSMVSEPPAVAAADSSHRPAVVSSSVRHYPDPVLHEQSDPSAEAESALVSAQSSASSLPQMPIESYASELVAPIPEFHAESDEYEPIAAIQDDLLAPGEDDPIAPLPLSTPLSAVMGSKAAADGNAYATYTAAHGGIDASIPSREKDALSGAHAAPVPLVADGTAETGNAVSHAAGTADPEKPALRPVFDPADPDNLFSSLEEITAPIERIKRGDAAPLQGDRTAVDTALVEAAVSVPDMEPAAAVPPIELSQSAEAPGAPMPVPAAASIAPVQEQAPAAQYAVTAAVADASAVLEPAVSAGSEETAQGTEPTAVPVLSTAQQPAAGNSMVPADETKVSALAAEAVESVLPQSADGEVETVIPAASADPLEADRADDLSQEELVDENWELEMPLVFTNGIPLPNERSDLLDTLVITDTPPKPHAIATEAHSCSEDVQGGTDTVFPAAADNDSADEDTGGIAVHDNDIAGEAPEDVTADDNTAADSERVDFTDDNDGADEGEEDFNAEQDAVADMEVAANTDEIVEARTAEEALLETIVQPAPIIPAKPVVPPPPPRKKYAIPFDLLTNYPDGEYWIVDDATRRSALMLKSTFNEFKIDVSITGIRKGPVVTMFEMLPSPGIKLSKITNLQDNIALRLAASSVRIVAPIPGKHAVGIEVPNKKRSIVSFRELIEADLPEAAKMAIPIVIGKDVTGNPQLLDLAQTPHLLIAGATGSGKSVCVNTIILSILYNRRPDEVKLILVDPKIVELKLYNDIAHLLTPVITEPKRAFQALQYALCEMERRYALLDNMGVRDIKTFNTKIKSERIATEPLPYIVIIIDEFADLMATSGKELEATVARLCAMSRAVGIHLVLATQRPSIDVITGLIKANIPSRIAFMVASKTDSRIILDEMGAEKLLGKGDMLFVSAAQPFPTRMQGAFVSEQEVERVVSCVKEYCEPEYIDDEIFVDDDDDSFDNAVFSDDNDPLYDQALEIVTFAGKASASYVQRKLKIGYNRAARLIEEMEARGIVGPANGSKPREVIRHR